MAWTRTRETVAAILGATLVAGCSGSRRSPEEHGALGAGLSSEAGDETGAVFVDGSVRLVDQAPYGCPAISGFSMSPTAVQVGQSAQLDISTVGPPPSEIQWMASPSGGGDFSDPTSDSTTFQCQVPGDVIVTVRVELIVPDAGDVCDGTLYTTYSGTIVCQ
jgi:hypothetical protein